MEAQKNRYSFLNVHFDSLTMDETLELIAESIEKKAFIQHVVINVAKLIYAQKNNELRQTINDCQIINVDGAGVVLGAKLLGLNIPERVTGIDLMERLVQMSEQKSYRIFFLGAKNEILDEVIKVYKKRYPNLEVAGARNGYFSAEEEQTVAQEIRDSRADILFVAISSPKKEMFLNKYKELMQVPFVMGVGGSFDVVAGKVKRAPVWMQNYGMEWVYRLIQEPGRMWKRYFYTNAMFLALVIKEVIISRTILKRLFTA